MMSRKCLAENQAPHQDSYLLSSLAHTLFFLLNHKLWSGRRQPPDASSSRSEGRNEEITQPGKICQGSRMINALYSSNYGTAPTSPHAVAEISPWGTQREMYHLRASVLFPVNRRLRNGALQTEKDAYISLTLMLRHWRSQHWFVPLSPGQIHHNSVSHQRSYPGVDLSKPTSECMELKPPTASPCAYYVTQLFTPCPTGYQIFL